MGYSMPFRLSDLRVYTGPTFALTLLLAACGGSGDSDDLESAIAVGRLDTMDIYITSEKGKLIFEPGETWQFFPISIDGKGNEEVITENVSWSTSDAILATVNRNGLVEMGEPVGSQDVDVLVQFGELTAELAITVSSAELAQIDLSPGEDPLHECQSTAFTATGTYTDGSERPLLADLMWTTDQSDLATFSDNLLLSHESGLVNVQVEKDSGMTGDYLLTMIDTLTAITVSSGDTLRLFVDDEVTLTALGDYNDGSLNIDISKNSAWAIDDLDVASLDQEIVTGVALGSTTLSVVCGGLSKNIIVDVVEFDDIGIVDPKPELDLVEGETRELELYRKFSNEDVDTENVASEAQWRVVKGDSIADVDGDGVLTMSDDFSAYDSDEIRIEAELDGFLDETGMRIPN